MGDFTFFSSDILYTVNKLNKLIKRLTSVKFDYSKYQKLIFLHRSFSVNLQKYFSQFVFILRD